jgi:hypothetical protein
MDGPRGAWGHAGAADVPGDGRAGGAPGGKQVGDRRADDDRSVAELRGQSGGRASASGDAAAEA